MKLFRPLLFSVCCLGLFACSSSDNAGGAVSSNAAASTQQLDDENSSERPADGSSDISADGSSNILADGSSNIPADGSSNILADGSSNIPADGSSNIPADGSSAALVDEVVDSVQADSVSEIAVAEPKELNKSALSDRIEEVDQAVVMQADMTAKKTELKSVPVTTVATQAIAEPKLVKAVSAAKDSTESMVKPGAAIADQSAKADRPVIAEKPAMLEPLSGAWIKKNQKINGLWTIEHRTDGAYLVLGDDFKTRKAPDLKFVLSGLTAQEANNKNALQGSKLVALLRSAKGAQEYKLPDDFQSYNALLLHCEKYTKLWGAADLSDAK